MKIKYILIVLGFIIVLPSFGQDDFFLKFVGHNFFNNDKLLGTKIKVLDGKVLVNELNTNESHTFKLILPYGKTYDVYLINKKCQTMYLRVFADIPADKRNRDMIYELDIPFFRKDDERFDTIQFQKPFHQIVFNGINKFVDDTTYMNHFLKNMVRPLIIDTVKPIINTPKSKEYAQLSGKISLDNDKKSVLKNKTVLLINKKGQTIAQAQTTNFGVFVFQHVDLEDANGISVMLLKAENPTNAKVTLESSYKEKIANVIADVSQTYVYKNSVNSAIISKLIDNDFRYNIGGKLISTNGITKKVVANKEVYLLSSKNNVIQKCKTNVLGNFLFTKVLSGQHYSFAIDTFDIPANEHIEIYTVKDKLVTRLDSIHNKRYHYKFLSTASSSFNDIVLDDSELKMNVKGKLYGDNKNNPLSNLKVLLMNDQYETIDSGMTDNQGDFSFKYVPYNKQVLLNADNEKDLLESFINIMVFDNDDNLIKLVSLVKGKKFNYKPLSSEQSRIVEVFVDDPWLTLLDREIATKKAIGSTETIVESILFDVNKAELLPQSFQTLDKVILAMQTNKNFNIELSAHSDSRGSDALNMALSEKRAVSAKAYIVSKGIDTDRIIAKGYGETKLVNNCDNGIICSEDEHAMNRRVEFKISYH
jgi:outer membrane protein OmpA-like peptidoglycan-associated protein